jgi:hypothetical protein
MGYETMTVSSFATITDPLGAGRDRFFGSGYKRVTRELSALDIVTSAMAPGTIRGRASVKYPADWSSKGKRQDLRPHLSTIDGLLLAIDLAETYLTHTCGFGAPERRRMWVRRFAVRAGAKPSENLQQFDVSAVETDSRTTGPGSLCTTFECRIGELRVICEIEHDQPRTPPGPGQFRLAGHILGAPEERHYGSGYQQRSIDVNALVLDHSTRHVSALVTAVPPHRDREGMEGAYSRAMSMLDALLALAQLAQVLVYECDGLARAQSDTLWMRRCVLARQSPHWPSADTAESTAAIERSSLLNVRGASWRTFEVAGRFDGLHGRASLAHRLPGEPVDRPRPEPPSAPGEDQLSRVAS